MTLVPLNPNVVYLQAHDNPVNYDSLINDWLNLHRSVHTRRAYQKDLDMFLAENQINLITFLGGDRHAGFEIVSHYKAEMMSRELAPNTINRRIYAIKSFVSYAYNCGYCDFNLENIKGEQPQIYRDTTGISPDQFKQMLDVCDLSTLKGVRDYALLRLFWSNALRREELSKIIIDDYDWTNKKLLIYGKGRNKQAETVELAPKTIKAINNYLKQKSKKVKLTKDSPLFTSIQYQEQPLSTDGIYKIIRKIADQAGITKIFSPHRIRHSSITAALDATDGDVRAVQKLSRHKNFNTLMIYDDNRLNKQGEVTNILDDLF